MSDSAENIIERKDRSEVIQRNNMIAKHASRKDLKTCIELYEEAIQEVGGANTHTYCATINAYIRCGDMEGAIRVFEALKNRKFEPDVVSYTTMIKGYCQLLGDIDKAIKLYNEMIDISSRRKRKILPNIRTINTILRGCVNTGKLAQAEAIFGQLKEIDINPDISSWEYIILLLCQSLNLSKILPMVGRLNNDSSLGLAKIHKNVAKAASILGDWKIARRSSKYAEEALLTESKKDIMECNLEDNGEDEIATGGKRAWKGKEEDDNRMISLQNYRLHILEDTKFEIDSINSYIEGQAKNNIVPLKRLILNLPYFIRTLFFSENSCLEMVLESLEKLGWYRYLEKIHQLSADKAFPLVYHAEKSQDKKTNKSKFNKSKDTKPDIQVSSIHRPSIVFPTGSLSFRINENVLSLLKSCFDSTGKLLFNSLFSAGNSCYEGIDNEFEKPLLRNENRPLKLEICSGNGDWATSQAENDQESDFITLELRNDRVYQTFTKAIFKNLSNLIVLGGDAQKVLPKLFLDCSVDHVFINHPEPPQQTGKELQSQAKHLLSPMFFEEINRTLKPDGKITIVTDNLWYARFLLKEFTLSSFPATLSSFDIESKALTDSTEWKVVEELKGIKLYSGKPGSECGHIASASSFFDRLWKHDNNFERYFFVLIKRASFEKLLHRQSSKRFGLFSESSTGKQNKKIKFEEED